MGVSSAHPCGRVPMGVLGETPVAGDVVFWDSASLRAVGTLGRIGRGLFQACKGGSRVVQGGR
jgi:hypothetical protein